MIMILKQVILYYQPNDAFNMEQLHRYQRLQCLYNKSNIAVRCFRRLTAASNIYAMNEIFELLNAMLKYGNREVQVYLLNLIKNSATQTSDLFRYIKSQFADSVKPIRKNNSVSHFTPNLFDKANEELLVTKDEFKNINVKVPEEKFIENMLQFIQYQCENCYKDFQNFFREQVFVGKESFTSLNLVGSTVAFLCEITEYDSNDMLVLFSSFLIDSFLT